MSIMFGLDRSMIVEELDLSVKGPGRFEVSITVRMPGTTIERDAANEVSREGGLDKQLAKDYSRT